jgi:transposase
MGKVEPKVWVGVDAGKGFHWAVVLDAEGEVLLSRKVENDEADLRALIGEVSTLGRSLTWATDQPGGTAALLLALLWEHGQRVLYVPGMAVDRARDAHRGESKTDARDARLIADQARMRRDLSELGPGEEALDELRMLVAHRRDLVVARTRAVTRLKETLLSLFPGLERALDLNQKGALVLVGRYQTPGAVRRSGRKRIEAYLKARGVRGAASLAEKALTAAKAQSVRLPAEGVAAAIVAELADEALALRERIARADEDLERRFFAHPLSGILASFPGMGPLLGAEFLVAVGDLSAFESSDRLAAYAGLVPASHDSGKRTGNPLYRMRGGNRLLKKVLYQSAFSSLRTTPASRAFYDRKRAEGKRHTQALVALARRRVNVLWAMLRDGTRFQPRFAA